MRAAGSRLAARSLVNVWIQSHQEAKPVLEVSEHRVDYWPLVHALNSQLCLLAVTSAFGESKEHKLLANYLTISSLLY